MKVAYLGKIQLSDVDLSYLHEAQQLSDVTLFMEVSPRFMRGPAFNIQQIYPHTGIYKAVEVYPEFRKYADFIDIDKFFVVNTCGRLWHLKSFWTNFLLLLFLIRGNFEVLHLAWPPNVYEFILYVLRHKMLLTVHDPFPHTAHDTFVVRLRRKFAFRLIPRLIILNKAQREDFIDFYKLSSQRVIDSRLSCYTYLRTVSMDIERVPALGTYILFAGRISPYKGLDYLLPAMIKVHECCPDSRLIVAGGGKYHFDISKYQSFDFIDIRNRFIPDEELVALINNAAFIVCPYTDATQSGVIMSAYAFHKPVIATNVGGLPEMVRHGIEGLIVNERDTEALTDAIISLWTNKQLNNDFSYQIALRYDAGKLSWKQIAKDLSQEYQRKTR